MVRLNGWPTFWARWSGAEAPRDPLPDPKVAVPSAASTVIVPIYARGGGEARHALAAARLLRGSLTMVRAHELVERLSPYRERAMLTAANPLDGVASTDEKRLTEATMRFIAPVIADVILPSARDYILDRLIAGHPPPVAVAGEATPSVCETAAAMRDLVSRLNGSGRAHLAVIATACEAEARARADALVSDDSLVGRDTIDTLARGLMRAEVLTLTLEALGTGTGLEKTRFQSLRLARFALRRASEVLEVFAEDRGLVALHNSLQVLAAVDGLIVVVLRILDAWQERKEESTPFVEQTDQAAMGRYVAAAGKLADTLLDMTGQATVTGKIDDLFFEALIRQIALLHRFCAYCGHEERPAGLDQLQARLVGRTAKLAGFAGDALVSSTMKPGADRARLDRLLRRSEAIAELLIDMNRPAELEALGVRILAVRDTLAHTPHATARPA